MSDNTLPQKTAWLPTVYGIDESTVSAWVAMTGIAGGRKTFDPKAKLLFLIAVGVRDRVRLDSWRTFSFGTEAAALEPTPALIASSTDGGHFDRTVSQSRA